MKRTPLRPGTTPLRQTPLAKYNATRRRGAFIRQFGSVERVRKIQALTCIVPGCKLRSENCHTKTRRTATWRDIYNGCWFHHDEQHQIGMPAFMRKYNIDPYRRAAELARRIPA